LVKLILFALISVFLIAVSWKPLHDWRSHGFFRLFAWESILALILLNGKYWFRDPLSLLQMVSWLMLLSSLALAIHGFWLLLVIGKPRGHIEDTSTLVTVGAYRYIRHPLYASLLWLGWGAFFKKPSLLAGLLAVAASALLTTTAKVEEAENLSKFGGAYAAYMRRTRMFIPFLF